MIKIDLNNFSIANNLPFVLIAGPCVIENEEHTLMMAEKINNICSELKINFIFKSSFDKVLIAVGRKPNSQNLNLKAWPCPPFFQEPDNIFKKDLFFI